MSFFFSNASGSIAILVGKIRHPVLGRLIRLLVAVGILSLLVNALLLLRLVVVCCRAPWTTPRPSSKTHDGRGAGQSAPTDPRAARTRSEGRHDAAPKTVHDGLSPAEWFAQVIDAPSISSVTAPLKLSKHMAPWARHCPPPTTYGKHRPRRCILRPLEQLDARARSARANWAAQTAARLVAATRKCEQWPASR